MSLNREFYYCGKCDYERECVDCYESCDIVVDYVHQRNPFEGHYPNKNEAKALRRIMAQTGLSDKINKKVVYNKDWEMTVDNN